MRFPNSTVRHISTKIFHRAEIFASIFFREHDSQPEATCLSSVKEVTATSGVQTGVEHFVDATELAGLKIPKTEHWEAATGTALCPHAASSFILNVCPNTVGGIRSSYFSCPRSEERRVGKE